MPALTVRRPRSLAVSYDPGIFGLPHQGFELSSDHRGQIQGEFEYAKCIATDDPHLKGK